MKITPHVNLLRSLRGERTNYVALIGEGVDNAFDAGAASVDVTVTDDGIAFKDNGEGVTDARIKSLFSLGEHGAMSTTQLGRFGVGIKSQAINAGNVFRVVSRSEEGRVTINADWRKVLKGGEWEIDDPLWTPGLVGEPTGTTIIIGDLCNRPRVNYEKTIDDLAIRFYPAIVSGKVIRLNGTPIPLLSEPALFDVVERQLALSDGRSAQLRAGILVEPSKLNRVHVAFRHRVIMPASALGCGDYGGLTKMFARLSISGPWHFAKFKDDLPDEGEREELEDAVEEALKPILEKCSTAFINAKIIQKAHLLNDMVPPALTPARPHHKKLEKTADGKDKGGRKRPGEVDAAKSTEGGPAKTKRPPRDTLVITFDGDAEEDGIGAFQKGSKTAPHRVNLSKDDPFVAELLTVRDEGVGLRCLLAIALAIFEQGREISEEQSELQFETFGHRIARHLAIQSEPLLKKA